MFYVDPGLIESALWDADLDEEEALYRKYSGRGMYGRHCFGIVGDASDLARFMCQLYNADPDLAWELAQNTTVDSMGRDSIFYFPGYQLKEEEKEEGEKA